MNKITAAAWAALLATSATAFAGEVVEPPQDTMHEHRADTPAHPAAPGAFGRAGESLKQDAHNAGSVISHGASNTGHAVKKVAVASGHAIAGGARATGHAISHAASATGHAIHRGYDKVTGKES